MPVKPRRCRRDRNCRRGTPRKAWRQIIFPANEESLPNVGDPEADPDTIRRRRRVAFHPGLGPMKTGIGKGKCQDNGSRSVRRHLQVSRHIPARIVRAVQPDPGRDRTLILEDHFYRHHAPDRNGAPGNLGRPEGNGAGAYLSGFDATHDDPAVGDLRAQIAARPVFLLEIGEDIELALRQLRRG